MHAGENMNIILSTRNPSKAEQIKMIFAGTHIRVLTLEEAKIYGEAAEDDITLEDNALKKALFAHTAGLWSMADDTGIFITALDGRPGVKSSRWVGQAATTEEITKFTLDQLQEKINRSALFRTVVAVIDPFGEAHVFDGEVRGTILKQPRTKAQPNMPYSPIFLPDGKERVWAEMTVDEENRISHRGIAFRKAKSFLITQV